MKVTVVRSPARLCWHIKLGDTVVSTANTREAAKKVASDLNRKYFNVEGGRRP